MDIIIHVYRRVRKCSTRRPLYDNGTHIIIYYYIICLIYNILYYHYYIIMKTSAVIKWSRVARIAYRYLHAQYTLHQLQLAYNIIILCAVQTAIITTPSPPPQRGIPISDVYLLYYNKRILCTYTECAAKNYKFVLTPYWWSDTRWVDHRLNWDNYYYCIVIYI